MTTRLDRLVRMEALIRGGEYPGVERLCQLFEVQPRTVYQDIKELREGFGLEIQFDRVRRGYFNAVPEKRLLPMELGEDGAVLLSTALELLCHFGGASFRGALATAADAIFNTDESIAIRRWLEQAIDCGAEVLPVSAAMFVAVMQAMRRKQELRVVLHGAQAQLVSIVPLRLILQQDGWYVSVTETSHVKPTEYALRKMTLVP